MNLQSLSNVAYYVFRLAHITVNNVMAIPAYIAWYVVLTPLRKLVPGLYWQVERLMFKALLSFVVMWAHSGGYRIVESGDDLSSIHDKHVLLLVNHQSTADIPCVMSALLPREHVIGQIFWIMDFIFVYTNFGWVSYLHGDFFIKQGKNGRSEQLVKLKEHLLKSYLQTDKRWIVLFPEGGFLYKRRERSQKYAEKHNHPVLHHCTLPRIGAVNTVISTLGKASTNGTHSDEQKPSGSLEWIVDMTLAYPKSEPIDMPGIMIGWWKPRDMHVHYRAYPISEIPDDSDGQLKWLYKRYEEKEELLDHFYKHGRFPDSSSQTVRTLPTMKEQYVQFDQIAFIFAYVFYAVSAYIFWLYFYSPILSIVSFFTSLLF